MRRQKKRPVRRLSISKLRSQISNIVERVNKNREYIVIEKNGEPVAGVVGLDELDDILEVRDEKLNVQIAEGWVEYKRGELKKTGQQFLDELRTELHGERRKRKAA